MTRPPAPPLDGTPHKRGWTSSDHLGQRGLRQREEHPGGRPAPGTARFGGGRPEEIGDLLRRTLNGHPAGLRDDQDYPAWRRLTTGSIGEIAAHAGGHALAPMTVLKPAYAAEMFPPLRASTGLIPLVLHADPNELGARIDSSEEFPGDEAGSEAVRAYRRRRAPGYAAAAAAAAAWMYADGHVIDTSALQADAVLRAALTRLPPVHLTTADGALTSLRLGTRHRRPAACPTAEASVTGPVVVAARSGLPPAGSRTTACTVTVPASSPGPSLSASARPPDASAP
ncbi:hypothetical protein OG594_39775 [Streptomyces sp. NBC_01214]|uniref:hypothetical protein n=1 Tax=Streptomyces sp. NBC_01214 TaxID=2903777 RepID=UPI00225BDE41|nr:hypothetical protein [Streptomyces sp. NBC_01214]MCX4807670.1 hypothetical protein [Streptomyces sp. NBC_01214]